jgi:hypothetical protein
MSHASQGEELLGDEPFLVLNAIYLGKLAAPERVAEATGLDPARVRAMLGEADAGGLIVDLGGQAMLSDPGRERVLAYYRDRYSQARAGQTVQDWYRRFEVINEQFIALVRQVASLRELAAAIPRYNQYATRFENGLTKIDSGERDFVCKPTVDSVHNIWFEFHEDILAVMGKPRET